LNRKLNPKPPPLPSSINFTVDEKSHNIPSSHLKMAPEKLTSTTTKTQKRIIYSREDILHANAAKDEAHSTRR
jgi:hypothetical protein